MLHFGVSRLCKQVKCHSQYFKVCQLPTESFGNIRIVPVFYHLSSKGSSLQSFCGMSNLHVFESKADLAYLGAYIFYKMLSKEASYCFRPTQVDKNNDMQKYQP